MTGSFWALLSGAGFGVFQTFNRRAVQGMDVFVATFLQLFVSAVILFLITILTVGTDTILSLTAIAILYFSLAGALHFLSPAIAGAASSAGSSRASVSSRVFNSDLPPG